MYFCYKVLKFKTFAIEEFKCKSRHLIPSANELCVVSVEVTWDYYNK
jgi:hypothetical protein